MTDANTKKRKRTNDASGKPKKKVVLDAPLSTATVSSIMRPKTNPPVIATTPGLQIAEKTTFQPYVPKGSITNKSKKSKHTADSDLLLHSSSHHSLDYTARQEQQRGSKPTLNHYLGVFDPKTGKLQVIEAKKMVVRGVVRDKQASAEAMGERDNIKTMMDRRADLGQTFGTKKAKKALEESVLNAISPQKKPGDKPTTKIDDATRAMLSSVGEITSTMATKDDLQAVVDAAKPIPQANVDAEDIEDVYDPDVIIGSDILGMVPIREWQEKVQHGESIQLLSRYVAERVTAVANSSESVARLRLLRYMYFVLLFYMHSKPSRQQRGTREVPKREQLKEILQPAPEAVVENIRRKFSDAGTLRKFHIDSIMAHCCVFACIIDNFEVDTQNLKDDLRLDQKSMNSYFHEIGGRVKPVSNKSQGKTYIGRLAIPLDFPKQRHLNPKRR